MNFLEILIKTSEKEAKKLKSILDEGFGSPQEALKVLREEGREVYEYRKKLAEHIFYLGVIAQEKEIDL